MKYGSVYLKKEGKDYKKRMVKYIQSEVNKQNWNRIDGKFVYMDEIVYSNRKGRDADNMKKLQQDCITESEVVWEDDSWCLPRTKRIIIDKYNPRIELVITYAPFIGIFDNEEMLHKFKIKCVRCTRYNNNCSILKKAIDNRVQPEIVDFKCSKFKQKNYRHP